VVSKTTILDASVESSDDRERQWSSLTGVSCALVQSEEADAEVNQRTKGYGSGVSKQMARHAAFKLLGRLLVLGECVDLREEEKLKQGVLVSTEAYTSSCRSTRHLLQIEQWRRVPG